MTSRTAETLFHGLTQTVRTCRGAKAARVIHASRQQIAEHEHEFACLTIPIIGSGTEYFSEGVAQMSGPCAIFHPPRSRHSDHIGTRGLETFSIQFDPAWLRLGRDAAVLDRPRRWQGGRVAVVAQKLARSWASCHTSDATLADELRSFLELATRHSDAQPPEWLLHLWHRAETDELGSLQQIAADYDRHPAWLGRCYRRFIGESLQQTRLRSRVASAAALLRESDHALAEAAVLAGFCDQSHMTRCFKHLLGRTPKQVREERLRSPEASTNR